MCRIISFRKRRLTISRLMLLIAASGLALGGGIWAYKVWPEVEHRRLRAAVHAKEARTWAENTAATERMEVTIHRRPRTELKSDKYSSKSEHFYSFHRTHEGNSIKVFFNNHYRPGYREGLSAVCRERAEYHDRMRRKWARAVWTPWVVVEPDPPLPPVYESGPSYGSY